MTIINSGLLKRSSPEILLTTTVTGIRFATIAGGALVDSLPAGLVALGIADGNHLLEIHNPATGHALKGVMSAAGDGEDKGAEKITDWTNHPVLGYDTLTESGINITSAIQNEGSAVAYSAEMTIASGSLFYLSMTVGLNDGKVIPPTFRTCSAVAEQDGVLLAVVTAEGANTYYRTSLGLDSIVLFYTDGDASFDLTPSLKLVTGTSTSGALIVSAKGGAVRNWQTNTFVAADYNLSSYLIIVRKLR